jgi:hypothetical protein
VYDEGIITFASTFTPYWIHIDIMIITLWLGLHDTMIYKSHQEYLNGFQKKIITQYLLKPYLLNDTFTQYFEISLSPTWVND